MRVSCAWVSIVHWSVEGADLVLTSHKQKSFKQTPHTACRDSEEQHLNLRDCEQTCDLFCWKLVLLDTEEEHEVVDGGRTATKEENLLESLKHL